MNRARLWATLSLGLLLIATGLSFSVQALYQKPRPRPTFIGPPLPISSLQQLWSRTPVVVLATAFETMPAQLHGGIAVQPQFFEVDEVLKDPSEALKGKRIRVHHLSGSVVAGGEEHVTKSDAARPPAAGQQAVLFLAPETGNAFVIPYGNGGLFAVTDKATETIAITGHALAFPEFSGRPTIAKADLLQLLRALAVSR